MNPSSHSHSRNRRHSSYLQFKAVVKIRANKKWKNITIKIFDNGRLQCFKMKPQQKLKFQQELDLLRMVRFGKSAKHHNCIEIFVAHSIFNLVIKKYKFQIENINDYVTFIKYLDKFVEYNLKQRHLDKNNKSNGNTSKKSVKRNKNDRSRSVESISELSQTFVLYIFTYFCTCVIFYPFANRELMKIENVTVDDLQRARLNMNECPKHEIALNFEFPDC